MKITLEADVNAPGKARVHVASQLIASRPPAGVLADKVVLIASELVTNAVQAGARSIDVDVRTAAGRLDLVVTDDAGGWPTPTSAASEDTAGRGLSIVEQLADAWDVAPRDSGKVVTASWFSERASADV